MSVCVGCTSLFSIGARGNDVRSETSITSSEQPANRFLRRIFIEGSLSNVGYEGQGAPRYSRPNGYTAGALLDLLGQNKLVLETGALYRQIGTTIDNGLGDNSLTANYVSVPISGKYYFSGQEANSLYLKAGVMGSTLISSNTIYATQTIKVGPRNWETAVLAGVGMKFDITPAADLVLEGTYARALESAFADSDIYRSDLNVALGMAFDL